MTRYVYALVRVKVIAHFTDSKPIANTVRVHAFRNSSLDAPFNDLS